jgi:hypothetical protein
MQVSFTTEVNSKCPQVNALVSIIKAEAFASPDGTITENQLRDKLMTDAANALKTRQDPWLIFAYYRKLLVDAGFLIIQGMRNRNPAREYGWEYAGITF